MTRAQLNFHRFACGLIIYNIIVVLWGSWVRISRSGDGCGDNWPHCGSGGEFVPSTTHLATWIEWTHRASTMVLGPLLLALTIWAFISFAKGNPTRKAAIGVLVFTGIEAWIGRHLVLNKLVVDDASTQRAIWMSLHLANILSLFACLTLTAWYSRVKARWKWTGQGVLGWMWPLCFIGVIGLAITGALSALGDTLYPAQNLLHGIQQDFAIDAVWLLKARPLHPLTATLVSVYVVLVVLVTKHLRPEPAVKKLSPIVLWLLAGQYCFGWWNLLILAPAWAQLTHLMLANLLWVALVLLGAAVMSERTPEAAHAGLEAAAGVPETVEV